MNVTEKQLESLKKLLREWEFQGGKDELLFIERDAIEYRRHFSTSTEDGCAVLCDRIERALLTDERFLSVTATVTRQGCICRLALNPVTCDPINGDLSFEVRKDATTKLSAYLAVLEEVME